MRGKTREASNSVLTDTRDKGLSREKRLTLIDFEISASEKCSSSSCSSFFFSFPLVEWEIRYFEVFF